MKQATRPTIFKWRQTAPELILCAVRWYLRYSLSLRDVEELFAERALAADHTTVWRWVQCYGPEPEQRCAGSSSRPTNLGASMRRMFERFLAETRWDGKENAYRDARYL